MNDKELIKRLDQLIELLTPKQTALGGNATIGTGGTPPLTTAAPDTRTKRLPALVTTSGPQTKYLYGIAVWRTVTNTGAEYRVKWTDNTTTTETAEDLNFL